MTIKSVIDIEIHDEPWLRFKEMFDEYRQKLKEAAGDWKQTGAAIDAASEKTKDGIDTQAAATESLAIVAASAAAAFHEIAQAVTNQSVEIIKVVNGTRELSKGTRSAAHDWRDMARDSKNFASNIYDATRSILKWASITGLIGGLLGGGGLFGIDRLAASAGSQRRSALGLGISSAEENAFSTNYSRVIDPNSFLTNVNNAMTDVTKRWTLTSTGLTANQLQGKNTADVASMLLKSYKSLADKTNPENLEQVRTAYGVQLSGQDFQRLRNTPADEIEKYGQDYERDKKTFAVPDGVMKDWQDLQVQLHRAGISLENVLITGLAKLSGPIGDLSKGFVNLVEALAKSPVVKEWIEGLAVGLENLAKWIGSDEFKTDVLAFVKNVGKMATTVEEAITAIAKWVEWFRNDGSGDGRKYDPRSDPADRQYYDPYTNQLPDVTGGGSLKDRLNRTIPREGEHSPWSKAPGDENWWDKLERWWNGTPDTQKSSYNQLEDRNGLPQGLLSRVEYKESSGQPGLVSSAGAKGHFGFMDGTAREYGVNVNSEASSADGAARYIRDLQQQFGSLEKGLAAYNWGSGNLQKDIDKHGDQWKNYLPDETRDYIGKILGGGSGSVASRMSPGSGGGRVSITVYNNTGGAAAITTSQLAV